MRVLNISRLSLILTLVLGLVAAWCTAMPKEVNGSAMNGGWYCCSGPGPTFACGGIAHCTGSIPLCGGGSGSLECVNSAEHCNGTGCTTFTGSRCAGA